ncbi:DNA primase family protein [Parafilimonas sp.]|uniref:DNA primase family protein n=1 Tax=Parafilimonas sp. TaxID=1969739 RepID=UPI0039E5021C
MHSENTEKFPVKISPDFNDIAANTIIKSIAAIKKESEATPHEQILETLIDQFEAVDFEALAFPEVVQLREKLQSESKESEELLKQLKSIKLNTKHYLIITIENILKLAAKNRWGLCKKNDFIYLYNGCYWNEISKDDFQKFLGEASEKMGVPQFSARFYQFREQLLKQFLATANLPSPENNNQSVLINLLNGTFQITTAETKLKPFNSTDFLTYQLPFKFDPNATAPLFEAYLNRVLPDIERQQVLAEYLGYVFIKHGSAALKEEKALILYGKGANGKSVFFEVVNALLGANNVSSFSLQSLTNDNGYFRAKLGNKLVNYASELNGKLETDVFKQLVSGEPVEARLPYGEPFILKQYAKLIFNCNELPKDVEHTNAYFRRFLIIPFDITIPEEDQDKQLHTKIIDNELSGVFNWVLGGLKRLLDQKHFSKCEAAQTALNKYKVESDSALMFLTDLEYKVSFTEHLPLKDIFSEYRSYCNDGGFRACSIKNFAERLRSIGYTTERKKYGTAINAEKNKMV